MKITLLQRDIVWADPPRNIETATEILNRYPDTDLFVLPEMWSTGFATDPEGIAEEANDAPAPQGRLIVNPHPTSLSLKWMLHTAQAKQCALAGSVAVKQEGRFYNRFYFVLPDGTYTYYDKHHLFTYGGEHKTYTPGADRVVVRFRGVRFLLLVCYDLRFPTWARNRGDYDCILYVASWPIPRQAVWDTLICARAMENQCFVAAVNRVGTDPYCSYAGGTRLFDAYGKVIAACTPSKAEEASAVLDMEELTRFRQKFPVLEDAD